MQHHEDTQIAPYAHPRAQLTPQNQPKTASKIENTHPNAAILTRKHTLPHFMQRALDGRVEFRIREIRGGLNRLALNALLSVDCTLPTPKGIRFLTLLEKEGVVRCCLVIDGHVKHSLCPVRFSAKGRTFLT